MSSSSLVYRKKSAWLLSVSVEPKFVVRPQITPLNPPFEGGKFSPPPLEGELEGVKLDLLSIPKRKGLLRLHKNKGHVAKAQVVAIF